MLINSEFIGIDFFCYEICFLDCFDSCFVVVVYVNIFEDCEEVIVVEIFNVFILDGDGINDFYDLFVDVFFNCLQNFQEVGMVIVN